MLDQHQNTESAYTLSIFKWPNKKTGNLANRIEITELISILICMSRMYFIFNMCFIRGSL